MNHVNAVLEAKGTHTTSMICFCVLSFICYFILYIYLVKILTFGCAKHCDQYLFAKSFIKLCLGFNPSFNPSFSPSFGFAVFPRRPLWRRITQELANILFNKQVSVTQDSRIVYTYPSPTTKVIVKMSPNLSIATTALLRCAGIILALGQHLSQQLLRPHDPRLGHRPVRKVHELGIS